MPTEPTVRRHTRWITSALFMALEVLLASGVVWLAALGGSWYYLLAGLGVLATSALVWRGRESAAANTSVEAASAHRLLAIVYEAQARDLRAMQQPRPKLSLRSS